MDLGTSLGTAGLASTTGLGTAVTEADPVPARMATVPTEGISAITRVDSVDTGAAWAAGMPGAPFIPVEVAAAGAVEQGPR